MGDVAADVVVGVVAAIDAAADVVAAVATEVIVAAAVVAVMLYKLCPVTIAQPSRERERMRVRKIKRTS